MCLCFGSLQPQHMADTPSPHIPGGEEESLGRERAIGCVPAQAPVWYFRNVCLLVCMSVCQVGSGVSFLFYFLAHLCVCTAAHRCLFLSTCMLMHRGIHVCVSAGGSVHAYTSGCASVF